jgi:hypothetical protein
MAPLQPPTPEEVQMHENRAMYEAKLHVARNHLLNVARLAGSMGDEGAVEDLNSMLLTLNALMKESLERKSRKPLRGQLQLTDERQRDALGDY